MLLCKFCQKECKNPNSLRNHERLCKNNPARQNTPFQSLEFQKNKIRTGGGTNQFIKAKLMGLEKPIVTQETRDKMRKIMISRTDEWNKENGRKISKTINEKVANGEWHTSLANHMHIEYKGIDLHGSWELKYAQYLDSNNIRWIRNKDSFNYEFEGKSRKYTPDFYLPDTDQYIEIKGYKTDKDEEKWSQFPKHRNLVVLMEKELKEMKIL